MAQTFTSNLKLPNNYVGSEEPDATQRTPVEAGDLNRLSNLLEAQMLGALSALGVGVVRDASNGLNVSAGSGLSIQIAAGRAVVGTLAAPCAVRLGSTIPISPLEANRSSSNPIFLHIGIYAGTGDNDDSFATGQPVLQLSDLEALEGFQLLAQIVTTGNAASVTDRRSYCGSKPLPATAAALGVVKMSVAPSDAASPVAVGANQGVGGVLSGNILNPDFSVDMATQAELNAVALLKADVVHSHTTADVTGFVEAVQDATAAFLQAGAGINVVHDDAANTFTITNGAPLSNEAVQDIVGAMTTSGSGATADYDDVAGTLTITAPGNGSTSNEDIQDIVAALLVAGTNVGLSYSDAGNTLTITASGGTSGTNGWTPILSVVAGGVGGAQRFLFVSGWTGGSGAAPGSDVYVGAFGYVSDSESAVDIRGESGASGGAGGDVTVTAISSTNYTFPTRGRNYLLSCDFSAIGSFPDGYTPILGTPNNVYISPELARTNEGNAAFMIFIPSEAGYENTEVTIELHLSCRGRFVPNPNPTALPSWGSSDALS